MYYAGEVLSSSYLTAQLEGPDRSQRSGLLAHRREAELAKQAVRAAGQGFGRRLVAAAGEFLIQCGRRLRDWGGAEAPATLQYR